MLQHDVVMLQHDYISRQVALIAVSWNPPSVS